ncbi:MULTISPECIES: hypothetical protein [unclassified Streptomyces]|uniref:hypothetical protein n=1 Tax=unclassified Streptomyces TaxID=2593676 RepID=UPI0022B666E1|nr:MULTISPECIES: hypothetical protein [unclassified Streptomyces]MCZ7417557.1 hypothetical protein [Streptomyces sp. WMMC897]MCZ7432614.1 hypothetical protein [Streptomyces sp. WMMC1477]
MARVRTARLIAAAAALPLTVAVFGGVAQADNGAFAGDGSNASVVSSVGSGVMGNNNGNSTTNQQAATGWGASNQANNASANGPGLTTIDQDTVAINFWNLMR